MPVRLGFLLLMERGSFPMQIEWVWQDFVGQAIVVLQARRRASPTTLLVRRASLKVETLPWKEVAVKGAGSNYSCLVIDCLVIINPGFPLPTLLQTQIEQRHKSNIVVHRPGCLDIGQLASAQSTLCFPLLHYSSVIRAI